ncbi:MAG: HD domain-containing protein [Planctomycetota bacterium]
MSLVHEAQHFAEEAHASIDQRRKYSGEPYIVHPRAVAKLVAEHTEDATTIAAAWLHDVVEDTPVTIEEIADRFGDDVAGLVRDLTNVSKLSDGNRKTRKALDRAHSAKADLRAKTVKLADIICNLSDLMEQDPAYAQVYVREKELQVQVLAEEHPDLLKQARVLIGKIKSTGS